MPEILFVKQQHKHACSIACVAMVTGENYHELIKEFGNDFHKYGIDDETLLNYIGCKGFSLLEKEVTRFAQKDIARTEMLRPFAPVHIVKIKMNADSSANHWVVMKKDGSFICPMEWTDGEIRSSYQVLKVVGVYKD